MLARTMYYEKSFNFILKHFRHPKINVELANDILAT